MQLCFRLPPVHWKTPGITGLVILLSTFAIGFLSGAPEGLLLGKIAVVVLQSLELLADTRRSPMIRNGHIFNFIISTFFEIFCGFSSILLLVVGACLVSSTYDLVKSNGETSMEMALALAVTVGLTGVTATAYVLRLFWEGFLLITSSVKLVTLFIIFSSSLVLAPITFEFLEILCCSISLLICLLPPLNTQIVLFITFIGTLLLKTKLILVPLIPIILLILMLKRPYDFQLIIAPVPLMLIITDIFNIAGQPIVVLSSPTNTSSAVLEGMFVGVLTTQLLMVSIGMSLFVSLYRDGAVKIVATAALSGAGVLTVTERFLSVLGPGPTIGILAGVAWTVGVSLSAEVGKIGQDGQVVDRYGYVGRFGVIVGAALGSMVTFPHRSLGNVSGFMCSNDSCWTDPAEGFV